MVLKQGLIFARNKTCLTVVWGKDWIGLRPEHGDKLGSSGRLKSRDGDGPNKLSIWSRWWGVEKLD